MAIKQQPAIKDFWPQYKRKIILGTIGMELLLVVIVLVAVISTAGQPRDTLGFVAFMVALVAGSIGINIILVYLVTTPLKNLANALTHVSNELSTVTPPNPNTKALERSGMKPLIQYIYESASSEHSGATPAAAPGESAQLISRALNNTKAGLIILDSLGNIKFANESAPLTIDTDGS